MNIKNRICILDAFSLKLLAIITMTIDHIGAVLLSEYDWLRIIGRLAFPIYCFLIVNGFRHTSNVKKYIGRLFLFALLSEIPFDLVFFGKMYYTPYQNVFFTLSMGLLMLELITLLRNYGKANSYILNVVLEGLLVYSTALLAEVLHTDYGFYGILMIYCFFLFENNFFMNTLFQAFINIRLMGYIQGYAAAAMIPIYLYNGKQGLKKFQYIFYWYYPMHLLILWLISNQI